MRIRIGLALLAVASIMATWGCSGGGGPSGSLSITPPNVTVALGASVAFQVSGAGSNSVTWSVVEPNGGSISSTGVYTAPRVPGTYHISATNGGTSALATVTVAQSTVMLTLAPSAVSLLQGQTQAFIATVTGVANTGVTYAVQEANGGSITASGIYTAPNTPGTYHVIVTSAADSSQTAIATITVGTVSVTITPSMVNLGPGGTQMFTASVSGPSNTAVTFSVQEANGGTITPTGQYMAPSAGGVFHVVATSQALPSATAVATVSVTSSTGVSISISPTNVTVPQGGTQPFTASVLGATNTAVTFSVLEANGGAISNVGNYTAPATSGVFHVVATSQADTSQRAVATVIVQPTGLSVTVSPPSIITATDPTTNTVSVTAIVGSQFTIIPTVTGTNNTAVTYNVSEGTAGGMVTGGVYTAPQTALPNPAHITVTSVADPNQVATIVVSVVSGPSGNVPIVIQ